MQEFRYVIRDPVGIHARPAGLLVKALKPFADTEITLSKGEQTVRATPLMRLMTLGARQGDELVVRAEGPREAEAVAAARQVLEQHL